MSALQILEFQMINVTKHCQIVYGRLNTAQMNQTRIVLVDTSNARYHSTRYVLDIHPRIDQ